MSFWDLLNEAKANATGSMEINVGFGVVPDNTRALVHIVDAKWRTFFQSEEEYLSVTWEVLEPESLRGTKTEIKHKIKDLDPSTVQRDGKEKAEKDLGKALKMFANIDLLAGGRVVKYLSEKQKWPTEDQINAALREKPMLILFGEWMQANGSRGNFIKGVDPKGNKPVVEGDSSKVKPMGGSSQPEQDDWGRAPTQSQPVSQANDGVFDEIPF